MIVYAAVPTVFVVPKIQISVACLFVFIRTRAMLFVSPVGAASSRDGEAIRIEARCLSHGVGLVIGFLGCSYPK